MDSLGLHPHGQLDGWIRLHVLVVSLADDSLVLVCLLFHFGRLSLGHKERGEQLGQWTLLLQDFWQKVAFPDVFMLVQCLLGFFLEEILKWRQKENTRTCSLIIKL